MGDYFEKSHFFTRVYWIIAEKGLYYIGLMKYSSSRYQTSIKKREQNERRTEATGK